MAVFKLLVLAVLVLLLAPCVSAKKYSDESTNETQQKPTIIGSGVYNRTDTKTGSGNEFEESGEDNDDHNDDELNTNDMTESEKKKLLELLANEGKPGWLKAAIKQAKITGDKLKKMEKEKTRQNKDSRKRSNNNSEPPTRLITTVQRKLSTFKGPLAKSVKGSISGLTKKWSSLDVDQRDDITGTLGVISSNIEKFAGTRDNSVGAIQGASKIIGSIARTFGLTGQLVSMGLGFVSALLGLFGKGPKPKPLDQIVREEINLALSEYRDQDLTDKAKGLVTAFGASKAYLDGVASSGKLLGVDEMQIVSSRVPMTQGAMFMGELLTVIRDMFSKNKAKDAKKCIKYCELYAQLTAVRDMILTQFISLASDDKRLEADLLGLIGYREDFRLGAKIIFENLYIVNYGSMILPYFDPDISVTTDAYATSVLNLGKYDRSLAGLYCLKTPNSYDLVWQRQISVIIPMPRGKTYVTIKRHSNKHCYWKLVPHGSNTYNIVNKYKCGQKYDYCGAMLSFYKGYVNIDYENPILWEITGNSWKRIRSKWGCNSRNQYCNKELRILRIIFLYGLFGIIKPMRVGQLAASDGRYYWRLQKAT